MKNICCTDCRHGQPKKLCRREKSRGIYYSRFKRTCKAYQKKPLAGYPVGQVVIITERWFDFVMPEHGNVVTTCTQNKVIAKPVTIDMPASKRTRPLAQFEKPFAKQWPN